MVAIARDLLDTSVAMDKTLRVGTPPLTDTTPPHDSLVLRPVATAGNRLVSLRRFPAVFPALWGPEEGGSEIAWRQWRNMAQWQGPRAWISYRKFLFPIQGKYSRRGLTHSPQGFKRSVMMSRLIGRCRHYSLRL